MQQSSARRHALLDDIGHGPRPIEKSLLVRADFLDREFLDPVEERGPIGEGKLRDDIEVDRVRFPVELVPLNEIVALVDRGGGRQAEDQWDVMVLVIVDERFRLEVFSLGEKAEYLQHLSSLLIDERATGLHHVGPSTVRPVIASRAEQQGDVKYGTVSESGDRERMAH